MNIFDEWRPVCNKCGGRVSEYIGGNEELHHRGHCVNRNSQDSEAKKEMQIKTTITINIGGEEFNLSQAEAQELQAKLNELLGFKSQTLPPITCEGHYNYRKPPNPLDFHVVTCNSFPDNNVFPRF